MSEMEMLGKKVIVTKQYDRTFKGNWKTWRSVDVEPKTGIITGFRTIYDGYVDFDIGDYGQRESGNYFVANSHKECVLVVLSPRQNPIKVPVDGFCLMELETS